MLAFLAVQVFPLGRGLPLYEALPKAKAVTGRKATLQLNISPEEEPVVREFFTQVAQLCGRPVVP